MLQYGCGVSSTGDLFSTIHGDLVRLTENAKEQDYHFNEDIRLITIPLISGFTPHIYSKLRQTQWEKLWLTTSPKHKESTLNSQKNALNTGWKLEFKVKRSQCRPVGKQSYN